MKDLIALANIQPSEPTVWVTPFADAVPEVKKMAAGASGDICGSSRPVPVAARLLKLRPLYP